jgi:uncharacterized protein with HEPN domain
MSKKAKSQLVYLLRMLEYCGKIQVYLKDITDSKEFYTKGEQLHFNASLTLLIQIGEQASKLDEHIKTETEQIPWQLVKGFRNIAVHEYQFVDAEKVYVICTQHINLLQSELEEYISKAVKENKLSDFELKLSVGSEFYNHVRFEKLN